ncbi:MAG: MAPEG family protein [Rickettsiales bacterium]|nr:MAPEG family protein [Rickettsiales bacterium]
MMIPVSSFYIAICALLLVFFSVRVIACRVKHGVAMLDGGVDILARHCRAQANFTEYAPLLLLLIIAAETGATPVFLLHAMGLGFVIGRISHFYSLTLREITSLANGKLDLRFRQIGMFLTFTSLIVGALSVMYNVISATI